MIRLSLRVNEKATVSGGLLAFICSYRMLKIASFSPAQLRRVKTRRSAGRA